ncbi:MAG: MraY family glycosyltransferase [Wenzhouxiangellaceae bacterium]|nr:MraY family glycosyltransferase [Wenzhouxiangellaceae bacterium]
MFIEIQTSLALVVSFLVASTLIPAMNGPAIRIGLIDHPDHRKRHDNPTPLTGGLGIFAGFIVGLVLVGMPWLPCWSLITGMMILLTMGLVDDFIEIPALARLLIQVGVSALMVYGGGLEIHTIGPVFGAEFGMVGLGPFSGPFTIACVVFMINAINMADGLDGLAGGIALIILLMLALAGALDGAAAGLVSITLLLALATLGFLIHNLRLPGRPRATAFLGDTGSMVLGFAIAWLAIAMGTHQGADVFPITIAWILIIPGMDTLALFFRRLRLGRSPFAADRTHLHHILRRCRYRVSSVVHIIHAMVFATALFGIVAWQQAWPQWLMFSLAAALLLGYQVVLANAHRILRWHRRKAR